MEIALGPDLELHPGIHGGLVAAPPPGVSYLRIPHTHHFQPANRRRGFDPFRDFSVGESVHYAVPPGVSLAGVHASRVPVGGGVPSVVDADCLITQLRYGSPLLRGVGPPPQIDEPVVRRRGWTMLEHYLRPSCAAVLMRTDRARREALDYIAEDLHEPRLAERLSRKLSVVRPSAPVVHTRRDRASPVRVVYMGRGFEDKGGHVAADVLAAVAGEARCAWVGPVPEHVRERLPTVSFHPILRRARWLDALRGADIFLSPTPYESFGMALVEAAASGTAIVATSGPGVEHLAEVFREGETILTADTRLPPRDLAAALTRHLRALIAHPDRLESLQQRTRDLAIRGPLALARRDRSLLALYGRFEHLVADTHRAPRPRSPVHRVPAELMAELDRRYRPARPRRRLVA